MEAGTALAHAGDTSVDVTVLGRALVPVHGFSFAMGHDASRLELSEVRAGPLFAQAEVVYHSIHNDGATSLPHGALFVLLDFDPPLDRLPVDLSTPSVLSTFTYTVRPGVLSGPTPLRLRHREFGSPRVAAIFVGPSNTELAAILSDGEVFVCAPGGPRLDSVEPDHGPLAGGTEVIVTGGGLSASSRFSFGGVEATVLAAQPPTSLRVLAPAPLQPGRAAVAVETDEGCAVLQGAFEYGAPPGITAVEPAAGLGGRITVRGERLAPESRLFVGDVELADVTVRDASTAEGTLASCRDAPGLGLHSVRVENLYGSVVSPTSFDCSALFLRGDANGDGARDVSDAVFVLLYLFAGGEAPACFDACDTDDSGSLALSDAIALLDFLFRGGRAPPPPARAGFDPTRDALVCGVED
jgi:hypothetical protein